MSRGFLFDVNTCTGCHACRLACTVENGLPWGESWRAVHDFNPENDPRLPLFHLSLACNHCDEAPCMASCPALAYRRDEATGAVLIEANRCIGCTYCSWACPYDAPRYSAADGVMTKCTLCQPRVAGGQDPACVAYCPTGALTFGELDAAAPGEEAAPRRRDLTVPGFDAGQIGPRIRFTPLRDERWRPSVDETGGADERGPGADRRLSLRSEWPLAVFTLLAAAAVAVFAAGAFTDRPAPWPAWLLPALAGMGMSLSHLGRRARAWRAVLNLRRSWVSREIVVFNLFLILALLSVPAWGGRRGWEWPAVYAGFLALWAMDRVYTAVRAKGSGRVHSAEVFDAGLYLTGWLAGWPVLAVLVGLYKLVLYLRRKIRFARAGGRVRLAWSAARVVLGFAVPVGLALDRPETWPVFAFAAAWVGEALDRLEFYTELRLSSPGAGLRAELHRRLAAGRSAEQGV